MQVVLAARGRPPHNCHVIVDKSSSATLCQDDICLGKKSADVIHGSAGRLRQYTRNLEENKGQTSRDLLDASAEHPHSVDDGMCGKPKAAVGRPKKIC